MRDALGPWLCLWGSVAVLVAYEAALLVLERQRPNGSARSVHAALRVRWVEALSNQPGSEIVGVQTLRNSLMSATISTSTAAIALMGTLSLTAGVLARKFGALGQPEISPYVVNELLLLGTLFASYVCSSSAMRYFHHAGYVMSLPVGSTPRRELDPLACDYVRRAGSLYSWGLRCFLWVAPLVAGLVNIYVMPPAVVALLLVLRTFDRVPAPPEPPRGPGGRNG